MSSRLSTTGRLTAIACGFSLVLPAANADFIELQGVPWITTLNGETYRVLDLYMASQLPTDRLLLIWNTAVDLHAKPGAKFFHQPLPGGAMTSLPVCYEDQPGAWSVDTYVSLGGEQCLTSGMCSFTPDTPNAFLVTSANVSSPAGWYIIPPISQQNEAGADNRIHVARFTIRDADWVPGSYLDASWTVGWAAGYGSYAQFSALDGSFEYPASADSEPAFDQPGAGAPGVPLPPPAPAGSIAASEAVWVAPGGWLVGLQIAGLQLVDAKCVQPALPMTWIPAGRADLDGDGDLDFVFQHSQTHAAYGVLMQDGAVANAALIGVAPGPKWAVIGVGDVSGDGKADLVWRNFDSGIGQVRVWKLNGLQVLSNNQIGISVGFEMIAMGDFNNDGRDDLLWRWQFTNSLTVWQLNGGSPPIAKSFGGINPVGQNWKVAATLDLDGDGDDDLVWKNSDNGNVNGWIVQNSAKVGGGLIAPAVGAMWQCASTSDLDGDGDKDILWQQQTDGKVNGWLMQGLVKQSGATIFSCTPDWMPVR